MKYKILNDLQLNQGSQNDNLQMENIQEENKEVDINEDQILNIDGLHAFSYTKK